MHAKKILKTKDWKFRHQCSSNLYNLTLTIPLLTAYLGTYIITSIFTFQWFTNLSYQWKGYFLSSPPPHSTSSWCSCSIFNAKYSSASPAPGQWYIWGASRYWHLWRLNPEFHWQRQIATTLRKFHWWFWIINWMQSPTLKTNSWIYSTESKASFTDKDFFSFGNSINLLLSNPT